MASHSKEIEVGSGKIFLVEDIEGKGHCSRISGGVSKMFLFLTIPDD